MKTERRHELQHNALADWLADQIERVRPYSRIVLGIVLAGIVVVGLYSFLSRQTAQRVEEGWARYYQAVESLRGRGDPDPLAQLASAPEFMRTSVGYWSALSLADYHLAEGIRELFNDRTAANASLKSAGEGYTRVANQAEFPMLAERAQLGRAQAFESLNELDQARKAYEELIASAGSGAYAAVAQQRLQDLSQEPTKLFYDWFFAATPLRQSPGLPGMPGLPGLPADFGKMPDERSFKSPESDSLLGTPSNKPAEDAQPGAEGEPASEGQSSEPAAEAPADAEKPAEPAPGADAPAQEPEGDKSQADKPDAVAPQ